MIGKNKKTTNKEVYIDDLPNTPFRFMWMFSMRQKKWFIIATTAVILGASMSSLITLLYKYVVDSILAGDREIVLFLVLAYPALAYAGDLLWRVSGYAGRRWATGMDYDVHNNLVSYAMKHSHGYFIDRFAGSLLSKVNNVANATARLIHDYLWLHLETAIMVFTAFFLVFTVDTSAGWLCILLLVFLVIVNKNFAPKQRILSRADAETSTVLRGHIVDTFTNISAVRQNSAHAEENGRLRNLSRTSANAWSESWLNTEKNVLLNMTILFVFTIAIMFVLSMRWQTGDITTGDLVLVIAIFSTISGSLARLGRAFNDMSQSYGKMEEGLQELILEYEIVDKKNARKMKTNGGNIVWKDVTFEFGENKVFDTFNLDIKAGQRIGLVGASGAGKTTFVSLLLRQHDIHGGAIVIDGQNIAEVTQDSLRKNIAVVPQEPSLFHRTIRENIAYGNPQATQEEIEAVAKQAQAHEFIMELAEEYDTLVGERGIKLSGGQKQRVAIARAMLKNAPILVLDEATSALDSESEVEIQKALHILMEGKTVIAVAHRLSTLREMDRIIVLEKGQVIEDGSHDELTKSAGVYSRLWEHQAGGFLQE